MPGSSSAVVNPDLDLDPDPDPDLDPDLDLDPRLDRPGSGCQTVPVRRTSRRRPGRSRIPGA